MQVDSLPLTIFSQLTPESIIFHSLSFFTQTVSTSSIMSIPLFCRIFATHLTFASLMFPLSLSPFYLKLYQNQSNQYLSLLFAVGPSVLLLLQSSSFYKLLRIASFLCIQLFYIISALYTGFSSHSRLNQTTVKKKHYKEEQNNGFSDLPF